LRKSKAPYSEFTDVFTFPYIRKHSQQIQATHPYRFGSEYIRYSTFADILAVMLVRPKVSSIDDYASYHLCHQAELFSTQNTPVYALDRQTLDLFAQSSIANRSDLFDAQLMASASTSYCVILPRESFPTVDGNYLEILWIESVQSGLGETSLQQTISLESSIYQTTLDPGVRHVICGGMDTEGSLWCSTRTYPGKDREPVNLGDSVKTAEDIEAIDRMGELALQILMTIEHLSESIEIVPAQTTTRGFGKQSTSQTVWHPRKISIEQKRYRVANKDSDAELSRKSPRPHWRKFHWRRVATGSNRERREWRLIQRTHVNPAQEI
jgi:hypothetical protein